MNTGVAYMYISLLFQTFCTKFFSIWKYEPFYFGKKVKLWRSNIKMMHRLFKILYSPIKQAIFYTIQDPISIVHITYFIKIIQLIMVLTKNVKIKFQTYWFPSIQKWSAESLTCIFTWITFWCWWFWLNKRFNPVLVIWN